MENPFSVKTPETLSPNDIASLFIDVFSDFPKLLSPEHTFIHGPRGSGKSMMLRYMEPQVQLAAHKVDNANELNYFAIHMPIRKANYSLPVLSRLKGSSHSLLAEHILVINAVIQIIKSLKYLIKSSDKNNENEIISYTKSILQLAQDCGSDINPDIDYTLSNNNLIDEIKKVCDSELRFAKKYLNRISFDSSSHPYSGALFGYDDFLLPLVVATNGLNFTPTGPLYLMLDDADNLSISMQKTVNSWVSYRSTEDLCLKVSTQQKYKTWRTTQGIIIESPHDYSEIDIRGVYLSKQSSHYFDRVEKIVTRRLELGGFDCTSPTDFFPTNHQQDSSLKEIKEKIKDEWKGGKGVSSRESDDVTRYTVSVYMQELAKKKKKNTFSYAGFKSMVNLSSGMIRNFLEPAAIMYSNLSSTTTEKIADIPHKTQNDVIYNWSQDYMLSGMDKLEQDTLSEDNLENEAQYTKVIRLKNLITSLGECFQEKLVSNDTERRYISFMLTNSVDNDIKSILDLAIEWGYLQKSTIARKEGVGRNALYILNRRLAPFFKLDPSGYAAHLSVTPTMLRLAMDSPRAFVRERLKEDKKLNSGELTNQAILL